jgi:hypothetical protein
MSFQSREYSYLCTSPYGSPLRWGVDTDEKSAYTKLVYPKLKKELDKHVAGLEKAKKIKPEWDTRSSTWHDNYFHIAFSLEPFLHLYL